MTEQPQHRPHHHGHDGHDGDGGPSVPADAHDRTFWEQRYASAPQVWSGRPNPQLVDEVADLPPGTALDLPCGEGGDALWLAARGWTVTAVDLAQAAVDRVAAAAAQAGPEIAGRVQGFRADITAPEGEDRQPEAGAYDLVTSFFLHLPPADRLRAFARLAGAVAPGGTLLVVAHHASDLRTTIGRPDVPELFFEPAEVVAALDPEEWEVVVAQARPRTATDPEGREVRINDTVVRARRR